MPKKEYEKLDKTNMLRVIELLEPVNGSKSITKKTACEILNISYNTIRLKKLIFDFKKQEENRKIIRAKLKGTPLTTAEIFLIIEEYLKGTAISVISEITFRPTSLLLKKIKELNIPLRTPDASYQNPYLIDEEAINEHYEKDDLVYSARYLSPALIEEKQLTKDGPIYIIYILGKEQCYATQPYYELADLREIQKTLQIDIKPIPGIVPSYNP